MRTLVLKLTKIWQRQNSKFVDFNDTTEVNRQETRVMGLSSSEDRMIVAGVVLA